MVFDLQMKIRLRKTCLRETIKLFFDFCHGNLTIESLTEIHLQNIFVLHPLFHRFAL